MPDVAVATRDDRAFCAVVPIFRPSCLARFRRAARLAAFAIACATLAASVAAAPSTVCTITVNSDNEREVLKSTLPPGDFNFVELVERGRPDWLASACKQKV